nr:MAG TPA: hypothetical protein [Caudoviricetes sp.]
MLESYYLLLGLTMTLYYTKSQDRLPIALRLLSK